MKIISISIVGGEIPKLLGAVCYEGDKNVCRLEFTGAEESLDYKLDLRRHDGTKNVLDLVNRKGILVLETEALAAVPSGRYEAQLRTVGDTVMHSNIAFLTVKNAIHALDAFPPAVPTELEQMEKRITEAVKHPPVPGEDGFWRIWEDGAYVPCDIPVQVHPVFVARYDETDFSELQAAWDAGKLLFCMDGDYLAPLYRRKEGVYFSFKVTRATDVVTRICYTDHWSTATDALLKDKLKELEQRIAALEAEV